MTKFEAFKNKEKFIKDLTINYPGAENEHIKQQMTKRINLAADDFAEVASGNEPTEKAYQEAIGKGLDRFSDIYLNIDTEDRERVCIYFEELMDIVGFESSGGQLNGFM